MMHIKYNHVSNLSAMLNKLQGGKTLLSFPSLLVFSSYL